jgi:2'-5' RNA ligase
MTLPGVIRIFFAIDLSALAKEKVGKYIGLLKKNSKTNAIRWTRPENLHITLQFLAEVKREHLDELIAHVRNEMAGKTEKAVLQFGSIHLFPNPYRPRVIVLEIGPQEKLASIAGSIAKGIKLLNYEVETRPFKAHLTLGRIKHTHGVNLDFLSLSGIPPLDAMEISEVVLFRSDPQPEGSKYMVIERIELTG